MLTNEEEEYLRHRLGCQLARIILDAHTTVDAEILMLCSKLDGIDRTRSSPLGYADLNGWKKTIHVELDMRAAEVLCALQRVRENIYGRCIECGAELLFDELNVNPTERFCVSRSVEQRQFEHN